MPGAGILRPAAALAALALAATAAASPGGNRGASDRSAPGPAEAAPAAAMRAPQLWRVPPGRAAVRALSIALPGDTVLLLRGVHLGPLRVTRAVVLRGEDGTVVDGGHQGTVLTVAAGGAVVEDLEVRASGRRVITIDAGVHVVKAGGVTVRRVRVRDCLYGIYAERAPGLEVAGCDVVGRVPPLQEDGEGNGIHLWYCERPRLHHNDVSRTTDGIYLSFVDHAEVEANDLHDNGRYGLHTMYCQGTVLRGNLFERNVAGCAIMFTNHLLAENNDFFRNRGPRTYGLLLRDCSDGEFRGNRMVENTVAAFLDNSNRNRFHGNLVQDNGWGLLVFASCANNEFAGNSFIHNDYPVALDMRRTTNRFDDGVRGNFWSDDTPYDLDGDGVSDAPHSPVNAFAFLSKQYPDLSVLAKSPAVAALTVAERVLPALRPSEAVDRFPRVRPARVEGSGRTLSRGAGRSTAWGATAGFAALALTGLVGLVLGRRAG